MSKKLAAVLSGQVRSFVEPRTHLSIRRNLFAALCPDTAQCTIKLVLCVELGFCNSNFGDQRMAASSRRPASAVPLRRFRDAVSALGVGIATGPHTWPSARCSREEQELRCGPTERRWCEGPRRRCGSRDGYGPIHPDLARWNVSRRHRSIELSSQPPPNLQTPTKFVQGVVRWLKCLPRLLEAERALGEPFDWVAVIRPDVAFFDPLPSLRTFAQYGSGVFVAANQYSPISDLFALMPRTFAAAYLSAATQLCCLDCWWRTPPMPWTARALARGEHMISVTSAEALLASQLWVAGVPVHAGYLPFTIVRPGPQQPWSHECSRWRVCNTSTSAVGDLEVGGRGPKYWPPCDPARVERCRRFASGFR